MKPSSSLPKKRPVQTSPVLDDGTALDHLELQKIRTEITRIKQAYVKEHGKPVQKSHAKLRGIAPDINTGDETAIE